jgi:hypothetical protein
MGQSFDRPHLVGTLLSRGDEFLEFARGGFRVEMIAGDFVDDPEASQSGRIGNDGEQEREVDSTEPLDLAWAKIFGQFNEVFVNGDQAFPRDVTTEC